MYLMVYYVTLNFIQCNLSLKIELIKFVYKSKKSFMIRFRQWQLILMFNFIWRFYFHWQIVWYNDIGSAIIIKKKTQTSRTIVKQCKNDKTDFFYFSWLIENSRQCMLYLMSRRKNVWVCFNRLTWIQISCIYWFIEFFFLVEFYHKKSVEI